jgi:hypothetical protein
VHKGGSGAPKRGPRAADLSPPLAQSRAVGRAHIRPRSRHVLVSSAVHGTLPLGHNDACRRLKSPILKHQGSCQGRVPLPIVPAVIELGRLRKLELACVLTKYVQSL